MESALVIPVLVMVLLACLAGIGCLVTQLRCVDAAAEAARLASRGDVAAAGAAVSRIAGNARLSITNDGVTVAATVRSRPFAGLLPGVDISATSVAALERGGSP